MDGTCKLDSIKLSEVVHKECVKAITRLNKMTICPLLDTGLFFSRYAVKLSSLHRISGWTARGVFGNIGTEDMVTGAIEAAWAILHIGQPGFSANRDMTG